MRTDVAVIGAGALGLSTALHCALRGRSVVVVDRFEAGSQASGRAAGLFKSVQADKLRTEIARRSIWKATHFEEWAGVPLEVEHAGSLLVARTDEHKAFLAEECERSVSWGADVRKIDVGELGRLVSYYAASGTEEACHAPEDVYVEEPQRLIDAYVGACRRLGVEILEKEAVRVVLAPGGRVGGFETDHARIDAAQVVDAAGAWSRRVGEAAGGEVAATPVRHQLLITEKQPSVRAEDPIVRVFDAAVYMRPARGGLMFGAFEPDPLPVDLEQMQDSFTTDDLPLDIGVLERAAGLLEEEVPLASGSGIAEHRGGMFTMTPDGRFLLGPVPGLRGLFVASGCNGSGFSSSPALGELLADWIVTGEPPPGTEALWPERFGAIDDESLVSRGVWQYAHYYDPA